MRFKAFFHLPLKHHRSLNQKCILICTGSDHDSWQWLVCPQLARCGAISRAAADHWFVHFRSSLIWLPGTVWQCDGVTVAVWQCAPVGPGPLVVSCGRSPDSLFMMQILLRKCKCVVLGPPSLCCFTQTQQMSLVSGIIRIDAINNLYTPSKCCLNSPYLCWGDLRVVGQHLQLPPSVRPRSWWVSLPVHCPLSTLWKRFLRLIFVELLWTKQTWWSGNKYPWFSTLVLLWCRHREKSLNYVRRNSCLVAKRSAKCSA